MKRGRVPVDRWRHRRAMAWMAFMAALAYPVLIVTGAGETLVGIAGPFYVFVSAVVGAYIGFATIDDRWQADREPWRYRDRGDDRVPMTGVE